MKRPFTYREALIAFNRLQNENLDKLVVLEIREESGELLHFYVDGFQEVGENYEGPVFKVEGDVVE